MASRMKNLQAYSAKRATQARRLDAQMKAEAAKKKPIALTPTFLQASLSLSEKSKETFYIPFPCTIKELKARYSSSKPIKLQLTLEGETLKNVFTYEDAQKEGKKAPAFIPLAVAAGELFTVELLEGDPLYAGFILYPEKEIMSFYTEETSSSANSQDTKPLPEGVV